MALCNEIRLMGNLTKEPSIIESDRGKFGKVRVAASNRTGDKEHQLFIDVKLFGQSFNEQELSSMNKGDKVLVYGMLSVEEFKDKQGNDRKEPVVYAANLIRLAKKLETKTGNEF